jgi:dipeptidyl-peptidase 4
MPETPDPLDEFPRQVARTRGFSLGVPRSFTVSPDGERVVYLRTKRGDDPVSCLWVFEVSGAKERLVFDPGPNTPGTSTHPPPRRVSRRTRPTRRFAERCSPSGAGCSSPT